MNSHLNSYLDKAGRFSAVVEQVSADAWGRQSPCEAWTAADVVQHVVDTQRDFLSRHDLAPEAPAGTPDRVWSGHLAGVRDIVGDGSALDRGFDGYFGPTTIGAPSRSSTAST